MKRTMIGAALALLMSSGMASAQTAGEREVARLHALTPTERAQGHALAIASIAYFAGSQNRCPKFHVIDAAVHAELAAVGIGETAADRVNLLHNYGLSQTSMLEAYAEDPPRFCEYHWKAFGPNNGERQMLEAK
jgi:hypothetical protein